MCMGIEVADFPMPGFTDTFTNSRVFIAHNTFKGSGAAVGITATFNGKTSCSVILNDTKSVSLPP